jgi:uncharacterized protein (DUF952 family)
VLYHLTTRAAWDAAVVAGRYEPPSLAREGFIHLSTEAQWPRTRERFYRDTPDLVLLAIDESQLSAEVRYELADGEQFPHLHGALDLAAVITVRPL